MKFALKLRNRRISLMYLKTEKVYGVSSRVKDVDKNHYLLFDIDSKRHSEFWAWFTRKGFDSHPFCRYPSPNGVHFICLRRQSFLETARILVQTPQIDLEFVANGMKRGYWFLQSWKPVLFSQMQHMTIERVVKNAKSKQARGLRPFDGIHVRT